MTDATKINMNEAEHAVGKTLDLSASDYVPWSTFLTRKNVVPLALVSLAVWLHAGDSLVVATMMPTMVAEVGGASLVGWSISLYQIGSIVAGAASALLTMQYGVRRAMALAALVFALGCLVSAAGRTMPEVLVGRLVQGFGGGGLVAMSFVAVSLFFEPRYRARALAVISTLWGIAAFLGPVIGSFFVAYANWRWGFGFFAVKAVLLAVWIGLSSGERPPQLAMAHGSFPLRRLSLLAFAVVLISFAGVEVVLGRTLPLCLLGLFTLYHFLRLDQKAGETRLFPRELLEFKNPIGAGLLMCLSMSFSTVGLSAFGPLLLAALHEVGPLQIGYVIASAAIGWSVLAVSTSGIAAAHQGAMIRLGMGTVALGVLGLAIAVPYGPLWLVALFSFAEGAGFGMCWHFIMGRMTSMAPQEEVQRLSGAIPTVQRIGYAFGAAYVGIVANASGILSLDVPEKATNAAFWIFASSAPFVLLGLFAAVSFTRAQTEATNRVTP
ncbi:MFS transporter [Cognatishimia activa]|uniref:MFS transporter n=1 Tax=Cognatishimia activa TaxID=1715691 RepID=UPI002232C0CA|nr:MFS transporter [Cognatishimia activa]UZD92533.1 MFS transporter [Cognatishimia activa]